MRPRTNHIDVKYRHFRSYVAAGVIEIKAIRSGEHPADILTKPVAKPAFTLHRPEIWEATPDHGHSSSSLVGIVTSSFITRQCTPSHIGLGKPKTAIVYWARVCCNDSTCCSFGPSGRSERECGNLTMVRQPYLRRYVCQYGAGNWRKNRCELVSVYTSKSSSKISYHRRICSIVSETRELS
jgi:hypothetical protein